MEPPPSGASAVQPSAFLVSGRLNLWEQLRRPSHVLTRRKLSASRGEFSSPRQANSCANAPALEGLLEGSDGLSRRSLEPRLGGVVGDQVHLESLPGLQEIRQGDRLLVAVVDAAEHQV